MQSWTFRQGAIAAAAVAIAAAAAIPLVGAQNTGGRDVSSELLVEVRALRMAMEQMASAGPRVQLAMGRLQLQEQRISTLLRRMDTVREQRAGVERTVATLREDAARNEEMAPQIDNPEERKALAAQGRALKVMADQNATELQRLSSEEAELAGLIATEQARWSDISKRLEELERALMR